MPQPKNKYKDWRCGTCDKLLGIVYHTGVLSIKHKEFYCWIEGHCKVICRFCGSSNTINTSTNIEDMVDM